MYETFEHKADIGIRGTGENIEEAFQEAAKALFSVEVKILNVDAKTKIKIRCDAANLEELLVEWLNALLAQASIHNMVFSDFKFKIKAKDTQYELDGFAFGEKLDVKKHEFGIEIKAATYSQLKVYQELETKKWVAQCIVDV